jgi:archaellum biogenesis protein FlaJ (TadC family)
MSDRTSETIGSRIDRGLYALFSRHAGRSRHGIDRERYRGTNRAISFEMYLSRLYGLSWIVGACLTAATAALGLALIGPEPIALGGDRPGALAGRSIPPEYAVAAVAVTTGALAKRLTITAGGTRLRWRSNARRAGIERTVPGAVRYLRTLADGSESRREMLRNVAAQDAYGETGASFERVLETAALTGSLDTGLRRVAKETPSRELLSPFLLQFRKHASQGSDSLEEYLRMESQLLSHRRSQARQRSGDYLELLAELFVVLLVLPALFVVAVTVLSVLTPELSATVDVSVLGDPSIRSLLVYGSVAFILAIGLAGALLVSELRPSTHSRRYERPAGIDTVRTATTNPASAAFVFAFPAVGVAWLLWLLDAPAANVVLLSYAAYGFPVGAVAVKREQFDDAMDRSLRDFVYVVAGHVGLGKPFGVAVETVAREESFGPLQRDISDLAFRLGLTTGSDGAATQREALDRFAERVGTPLAAQTIGLLTGALAVGSDVETTFEALQVEVGSLYHQRRKLRSVMLAYVVVGWTLAVVIVVLVVAVNAYVLDGMAHLSTVSARAVVTIDPGAIDVERDRWRFYLVTQATVLACGWFAGVASRGRYEALLHSAALVVICYLAFAGAGMV